MKILRTSILPLLLLILALLLSQGVLANGPEAASGAVASGACGPSLTWELSADGALTITGSGVMSDYIDGTPAPWQEYAAGKDGLLITSVAIGEGVTSIGQGAFGGCFGMTSASLPSSLVRIGSDAFYGCSALTAVTIPDAVTAIESHTFAGCSALTAVSFGQGITAIGNEAFSLSGIVSAELPAGVTLIQEKAFYGCGGLTLVDMPSVTTLENGAFENCPSLVSVTAGSLTAIPASAFAGCSSLSSLALPETLTTIGENAFRGCASLGALRLPSSLAELAPYAFRDSGLTSIILGDGITAIPEGAFESCASLSSVTLGESVTEIGSRAFLGCPALRSILLPRAVSYVAPGALGCYYVETAEGGSFVKYTDFNLEIQAYVPSVAKSYAESNGFLFTSLGLIDADGGNVTDTVTWAINTATGVLKLNGRGAVPDYPAFENTPWALYRDYIRNIVVGSGITHVGAASFEGCAAVATVSLSSTIASIGSYAFAGTSLQTVTLPQEVTAVGDGAFEGCQLLQSVTLPEKLSTIGAFAFRAPNALTSLRIPEAVSFIGESAVGYAADNTLVAGFVIKGVAESVAENYAKTNGITFHVDGFIEITDSASGASIIISGESNKNFALSFVKSTDTLSPSVVLAGSEYALIYDVSLTKNGAPISFEGGASIRFPVPENVNPLAVTIFAVGENGVFTAVETTVEDGSFRFSHDSLGRFVLTNADLTALYTVTIRHLYEDGSEAGEPERFSATSGATFTVRSRIYEGHQADRASLTGKVESADVTLSFTYKKIVVTTVAPETAPPAVTDPVEEPRAKNNDRVLLIALAVVLVLAIFATAVALVVLNAKKKNELAKRTAGTGRARKTVSDEKFAKTMVIPDAPTREIDIRSLFADEPEEDTEAITALLKQKKKTAPNKPSASKSRRAPQDGSQTDRKPKK